MSILYVMIPMAMVLLALAVAAFFWAVNAGQFDDLEAEGSRILFDDEMAAPLACGAAAARGIAPGEDVAGNGGLSAEAASTLAGGISPAMDGAAVGLATPGSGACLRGGVS